MQITVKSSKVLKTGTSKKGPWELIAVEAENGEKYTTFDKKALSNPGTVLEIGQEVINDGKHGFEACTVISAPAIPPVSVPPPEKTTPEAWAEKDKRERASIESQTAYKGAVELIVAGKASKTLQDTAEAWAIAKMGLKCALVVAPAKVESPKSDSEKAEPDNPTFTNPGEFYTACFKHYGINKTQVDKEINPADLNDPKKREAAWLGISAIYRK